MMIGFMLFADLKLVGKTNAHSFEQPVTWVLSAAHVTTVVAFDGMHSSSQLVTHAGGPFGHSTKFPTRQHVLNGWFGQSLEHPPPLLYAPGTGLLHILGDIAVKLL
jgi:hypothetical protein